MPTDLKHASRVDRTAARIAEFIGDELDELADEDLDEALDALDRVRAKLKGEAARLQQRHDDAELEACRERMYGGGHPSLSAADRNPGLCGAR